MTADFRCAAKFEKDHNEQTAVLVGLISFTEGPPV